MSSDTTADFLGILRILAQHRVRFVVVGNMASVLQGAPIVTGDVDIVHDRSGENVDSLLAALQELGAYYRLKPHDHIEPKVSHLVSPGHQLLMTRLGPLDVLGVVGDRQAYADLLPDSFEVSLGDLRIRVLDLAKVIDLKVKTGRDKDKMVLPILRRTLELRDGERGADE